MATPEIDADPLRLSLSSCSLAPSAAAEAAALYELPREAVDGSTVTVDVSFNTGATPFCAVAGIALAVLRRAAGSRDKHVSVAIDCRHTHFAAAPTHARFPESRTELDRIVSLEYPVPADVQQRRDALDFAFDGSDDHAECSCASQDFDGLVGDFLHRVAAERLPLVALQLHQCFVAPALGKTVAHAASGVTAIETLRRLDVSFLPCPLLHSRSQVHQSLELRRLERALPVNDVATSSGPPLCDFHTDEDVVEVARSLSSSSGGAGSAAALSSDEAPHVASAAASSPVSSCDDDDSDVDEGPDADDTDAAGSGTLVFSEAEMLAPFGPSDPPSMPKTVPRTAGAVPSRWVAPSTNPVPPRAPAAMTDADDAKPKKRKLKKVKKGSKKKKAAAANAAVPSGGPAAVDERCAAPVFKAKPAASTTAVPATQLPAKATATAAVVQRPRRSVAGRSTTSLVPASTSLLRQAPPLVARSGRASVMSAPSRLTSFSSAGMR